MQASHWIQADPHAAAGQDFVYVSAARQWKCRPARRELCAEADYALRIGMQPRWLRHFLTRFAATRWIWAHPSAGQSCSYDSYKDWRYATERARKAAKRVAAASPAAVKWQPPKVMPAPTPPSPPCARPGSCFILGAEAKKQRRLAELESDVSARAGMISQAYELESRAKAEHAKAFADGSTQLYPHECGGQLPGQLQDAVLVTPRGSRAHKLNHISPGGTARDDEYVSPAGLPQLVCEERRACIGRLVAGRRLAHRHAESPAFERPGSLAWGAVTATQAVRQGRIVYTLHRAISATVATVYIC